MPDESSKGRRIGLTGLFVVGGFAASLVVGSLVGSSVVAQIDPAYKERVSVRPAWKEIGVSAGSPSPKKAETISYAAVPAIGDAVGHAVAALTPILDVSDREEKKADAESQRWQASIDAELRRDQARLASQRVGAEDMNREAQVGSQSARTVLDEVIGGDLENRRSGTVPDGEVAQTAAAGPDVNQ